jgi:hypothetical protein
MAARRKFWEAHASGVLPGGSEFRLLAENGFFVLQESGFGLLRFTHTHAISKKLVDQALLDYKTEQRCHTDIDSTQFGLEILSGARLSRR